MRVQGMQAALDHVVSALTDPQWLAQAQAATAQLLEKGRGAVAQHMTALRAMAPFTMDAGVA